MDSIVRISDIGFVRKSDSASFEVNCGDDGGGGDWPETRIAVVGSRNVG